jgi:hypothetical protein
LKGTVLILSLMASFCAVEEFGLGDGIVTIHNADRERHRLTVSDSASCFSGLRTELNSSSTRTFPIDERGAYLCVGDGGGVRLENGARYTIRGGAVSLDR